MESNPYEAPKFVSPAGNRGLGWKTLIVICQLFVAVGLLVIVIGLTTASLFAFRFLATQRLAPMMEVCMNLVYSGSAIALIAGSGWAWAKSSMP